MIEKARKAIEEVTEAARLFRKVQDERDEARAERDEAKQVVQKQAAELLRLVEIVSHIRAHHRHDEQACADAMQQLLAWLSGLEVAAFRSKANGEKQP